MIKPSRVKFGAHARNLLPKARKSLELLGRIGTEIDEGKDLRQSAAGKHLWRGAVCREQRDIKPGVKEHLPDRAHVSVVAAERSVFVLDLRHQNGAAARDLERSKLCANVQHIAASSCEETGISAADPDVRRGQQPSGKTAEVPFSATVGTGTENHPQTFLLGGSDEGRSIVPAGKVELSGPHFVEVPEHVSRHRI